MKSNRFWIIVLGAVVLVCLVTAVLVRAIGAGQGSIARIYSGGVLVETVDLNTLTEKRMITIYAPGGNDGFNVIEAGRGRIRVADADCGGDCVRQGWVPGGFAPIVCLPHGLVIQIEGGSDIDGVVR